MLPALVLASTAATPLDRLERYLATARNVEFTITYQARGFGLSKTVLRFGEKGERSAEMNIRNQNFNWVATPAGMLEVDHEQRTYARRSWTSPLPSLEVVPTWALPDFLTVQMIADMRELPPKRADATTLVWEREADGGALIVTLVVDAQGAPKSYARENRAARDASFAYVFSPPKPLQKGNFPSLVPPPGYTPSLVRPGSLLPGPGDQLPTSFAAACGLGANWSAATKGKTTLFWLSQEGCPLTEKVLRDMSWQQAARQAGVPFIVVRLKATQFNALERMGFDLPGTPYGLAIAPDGTIRGAYAGFGRQFTETLGRLNRDLAAKFE